ncbi:MAG TPA: chloride channel protein [bacterium]|nr:chloride channel protein [bacterium]HPS30055.1 chloride channel protein [bacterium]
MKGLVSRVKLNELLEKAKLKENTFLIFVAILIGIAAGCAFLFFHWLIDRISMFCVGENTNNSVAGFKRLPLYYQILLPLSGVFISGFIIRYISKESGGAGIGLLLKFMKVKNGIMPPMMTLFKIVTSALSIGTGIPLGSEGPIIMIGSSVGSTFGQLLSMPVSRIKLFVGCGAAAGLAVAFNAPIAGTILAVETILGSYAIGTLTPIVVAAATASFFGAFFLPGHEVIPHEALALSSPINSGTQIFLFIIFGLINAFLGLGLIKLTYRNSVYFDRFKSRLPEFIHIPLFLLPFALTVPFVPEIFGLGKDIMIQSGGFTPQFLIGLAVLKLFFLSIAFASGASGGIFLPIIFVGYIFGLGFGKLLPVLFTGIDPGIGLSFASVGIGALLGAATQEPISSLIIVFEITRDYNIMPSLMLSTVVAVMISKTLSKYSIYNYQLFKEGIPLEDNEESTVMSENTVELCMRELSDFMNIDSSIPKINSEASLSEAVKMMTENGITGLIVVNDDDTPIGSIHEHDLINLYNREILSKGNLLKTVQKGCDCENQHILLEDQFAIEAIHSTPKMWGKTLIDLKLREKYNILVLAVNEKGNSKSTICPSKEFSPGDVLITAGRKEDIQQFKNEFKK